jgi:hypothetical protein
MIRWYSFLGIHRAEQGVLLYVGSAHRDRFRYLDWSVILLFDGLFSTAC